MLKWTSESEYFLSFEKFLQTLYIPVQEQSLNPSAARARRGVIMVQQTSYFARLILSHGG